MPNRVHNLTTRVLAKICEYVRVNTRAKLPEVESAEKAYARDADALSSDVDRVAFELWEAVERLNRMEAERARLQEMNDRLRDEIKRVERMGAKGIGSRVVRVKVIDNSNKIKLEYDVDLARVRHNAKRFAMNDLWMRQSEAGSRIKKRKRAVKPALSGT